MSSYITAMVTAQGDVIGISLSKPVNGTVVSIGFVNDFNPDAETLDLDPEDLQSLRQMIEIAIDALESSGDIQ